MRLDARRPFLLLALVTACAAAAFHLSHALTAKSDSFYLHYLGYRWFEPERAQQALAAGAQRVPSQAAELRRRDHSRLNYPVAAAGNYLAAWLFPGDLPLALAGGFILPFLIGLGIAAAGLWRTPGMDPPVALAVGIMALTAFLPGPSPTDHLTYHGGIDNLLNLAVLTVNPGEAFSPLSVWPKCSLSLIFLAALANRWSGQFAAGYLLLSVGLLFHLTLGALLILGMAAMDFALDSRRVRGRWFPAVIVLALAALIPGQWRIVTEGGQLPQAAAVAVAALLAVFALRLWATRSGGRTGSMETDTAAFLAAAVLFTPAAMLLVSTAHAGHDTSAAPAVFTQLAARLIVLAVTTLLLFLCVRAARACNGGSLASATGAATLFACLFTLYGAAGSWWQESRHLPDRLHDTTARAQSEPLTGIYHDALVTLSRTHSGAPR